MPRRSAGLLMYRHDHGNLQIFLVHPGGPYWARKDTGAWSIPKGEYGDDESPFDVARREFQEETGHVASGDFIPLTPLKQPSGKTISAWAFEGDCDPATIQSNTFTIEWPPRSGQQREFPEVDRAAWFELDQAHEKIIPGQRGFLDELQQRLKD